MAGFFEGWFSFGARSTDGQHARPTSQQTIFMMEDATDNLRTPLPHLPHLPHTYSLEEEESCFGFFSCVPCCGESGTEEEIELLYSF